TNISKYGKKFFWDYGDGSPLDSNYRPMHKYATYGRYKVTLYSKDSLGRFDTTYGYVNISKPVAKIGFTADANGLPINIFNCGVFATMFDSSSMRLGNTGIAIDSVKTNYWWFGENKLDTTKWETTNNFKPTKVYRSNGLFRVKLVSESYLGCKDTTYDTVFIRGPRPMFRLVDAGDTIGCAPFKVRLVNMADSLGKYVDKFGNTNVADTPTLTTYFDWGDHVSPQTPIFGRRDTVEFIYNDSGTFEIYGYGSDAALGGQNSCALVAYPDTTNNPKIRVTVLKLSRQLTIDKSIICKDHPVNITNNSSTMYKGYSYRTYRDTTLIDSSYKGIPGFAMPYTFAQTFSDTGSYMIIGRPEKLDTIFSAAAAGNCKIPDTVSVKVVYPLPLFSIDTIGSGGIPKVNLINNSDTTINVQYEWTVTKDGASTPKFTYSGTNADRHFNFDLDNDTGTFTICLKAFAKGISPGEGCAVDTCQKIKNSFNINVEVPNVFSPNGDGKNDEFKIRIEGEQKYKLTIYNRWGGKVFESGEAKKMWNGKTDNNGSECPAGGYYYIFDYQLRTETDKTKTGSITLIR
ncbi:MAG: gliding motility-associated C-terminal domain-containing protein, partial [Bacteroidota bacterium]